jgi:hypothetical protein
MRGNLPAYDEEEDVDGFTINNAGIETLLGTHRYVGGPRPAPIVRFDGCTDILALVGDFEAQNAIEQFPLGFIAETQITRVSSFDDQGDIDSDGIFNDGDNCINAANADQRDRGRPATNTADAIVQDGTGDACQCGDGQLQPAPGDPSISEPGAVLLIDTNGQSDLDECRRAAAGDPTMDPAALARCSVTGGFQVTAADLLLLEQALDATVIEVTPNDIEQVCQPALVPPSPAP